MATSVFGTLSLFLLLQFLSHLQQVLTDIDGVALLDVDHTVESVANQEERQRLALQFHSFHNLLFDSTVDVRTPHHR